MAQMIRTLLLLAALAAVAAHAEAQTHRSADAAGPTRSAIDEVLELSGIRQQTEWIALKMRTQFPQSPGLERLKPTDRAALDALAADAFRAETFYSLIKNDLGRHADAGHLTAAVAWYRSPLGRKIAALELVATMAPGRESGEASRLQPPRTARLSLIERLESASRTSESALDLVIAVARGISTAIEPFVVPDRRPSHGQFDAEARQLRAEAHELLRQAAITGSLITYRSLSDEELEQYIRFMESHAGRWFSSAVQRALIRGIANGAQEAVAGFARVVPPDRWGGDEFRTAPPSEEHRT